jgi:hypothetical protein
MSCNATRTGSVHPHNPRPTPICAGYAGWAAAATSPPNAGGRPPTALSPRAAPSVNGCEKLTLYTWASQDWTTSCIPRTKCVSISIAGLGSPPPFPASLEPPGQINSRWFGKWEHVQARDSKHDIPDVPGPEHSYTVHLTNCCILTTQCGLVANRQNWCNFLTLYNISCCWQRACSWTTGSISRHLYCGFLGVKNPGIWLDS